MAHDNNICILDFGSGNIRSVYNMLLTIAGRVIISNASEDIVSASHIILPGVGAFGAAMEKIKKKIDMQALTNEVLTNKKPFLGICVGMQVLADVGYEFGEHSGLGWIPGSVVNLDAGGLPLPHVGWNNIEAARENTLLEGLDDHQDFYFVHSYAFQPKNNDVVVARTEYGRHFASVVSHENIFGVQFHPEKSQKAGVLLLKNFIRIPRGT